MQIQNIQNVIDGLELITSQCKITQNKASYFAALYKRMTVAVRDGIIANQFEDGPRMERLDMIFAQRYLDAYAAYFLKEPCSTSWCFAFDACKDESLIVLQHLLLGINTHINLDLAIAAAAVAPGNAIHALQKDFYHINNLIGSLMDDIQECLCQVWLPMRMLMKVANGKQMAVLNFSIDKAREASWASAVLLASMNDTQKQAYIHQMDITVHLLGNKIKMPGIATAFMLKAIRTTEYDEVARTVSLIESTMVG